MELTLTESILEDIRQDTGKLGEAIFPLEHPTAIREAYHRDFDYFDGLDKHEVKFWVKTCYSKLSKKDKQSLILNRDFNVLDFYTSPDHIECGCLEELKKDVESSGRLCQIQIVINAHELQGIIVKAKRNHIDQSIPRLALQAIILPLSIALSLSFISEKELITILAEPNEQLPWSFTSYFQMKLILGADYESNRGENV